MGHHTNLLFVEGRRSLQNTKSPLHQPDKLGRFFQPHTKHPLQKGDS